MKRASLPTSAFVFLACVVGSLAMGLIFYGTQIFQQHLTYSQFLFSGVFAAACVAAWLAGGRRGLLIGGLVCLVVLLAYHRPASESLLRRDVIYIVGLVLAVWVSLRASLALARPRVGRFLLWGAIFGVTHLLLFGQLVAFRGAGFDLSTAMLVGRIGTLVGLGVGLGYELVTLASGRALRAGH